MQPITKPQPLDPDRPLNGDRNQFIVDDQPETEQLTAALRESCAYADQLWENLNSMRKYLLDSLPADPSVSDPDADPDTVAATGASPTGPDDEVGWNSWIDAFAAVTSILCGPNGDSGFGVSRARAEASDRRAAPRREQHLKVDEALTEPQPAHRTDSPAQLRATTSDLPAEGLRPASGESRWASGKAAVALILTGVVLGSLRPHRSESADRPA